jgi:hypothetical protein
LTNSGAHSGDDVQFALLMALNRFLGGEAGAVYSDQERHNLASVHFALSVLSPAGSHESMIAKN